MLDQFLPHFAEILRAYMGQKTKTWDYGRQFSFIASKEGLTEAMVDSSQTEFLWYISQ